MRLEKKAIVSELQEGLKGANVVILTDYRGLKVRQGEDLRRRLAKVNARFNVVKNSFLRLALSEAPWMRVDDVFGTPTAVVIGRGDAIETAKVVAGFQQEQKILAIKRCFLDNRLLSPSDVEALVQLPSRQVLLGMFVGALAAPMSMMVGVFKQKMSSIVYALKAVQEKKSMS